MARPKKIQNLAENIKPSDKAPQIIFPDVRVAGENHPLEDMWIDGNFPELKAVGCCPMKCGENAAGNPIMRWMSYTMTTKGPNVTKIEISEPDIKAIAEETAKIAFVTHFIDQDANGL